MDTGVDEGRDVGEGEAAGAEVLEEIGEAGARRYDLDLFERLNEEYRTRPIVAAPPRRDAEGRMKRARFKLSQIAADVAVKDKRVLDLGCAEGQLTRQLRKRGRAKEAIGVDVFEAPTWEKFSRPKVSFHRLDLARENPFGAGSIDLVVSNSVLEHVERPLQMLETIATLLKTGGEAWLTFNLYRGPKASHRYREVFFPWPHLLFEPAVCAEYYRKHHGVDQTFAWVNRLTALEYLEAFASLGLHVVKLRRDTTPIDLDFYERFVDKLGGFPALDLETDFLWLVLKKRRWRPRRVAKLGYVERQRELDALLAERMGGVGT